MVEEIKWRKKARSSFLKIIAFLQKEWSDKIAEEFVQTVEEKTKLLKMFPKMGIASEKKNGMRKLILSKQNMLVYRIKENKIIMLTIYDTRQDPIKIDA